MQITIQSVGFDAVMADLRTLSGDAGFRPALRRAMDVGGKYLQSKLEATTSTWAHKVEFERDFAQVAGGGWAMAIMTDDDIWNWTDRGTKPHTISARNAPFLVFRMGGTPKTIVGIFGSVPAGAPDGDWVKKKSVRHPGTKAREWSALAVRYFGETAINKVTESLLNYLASIWR